MGEENKGLSGRKVLGALLFAAAGFIIGWICSCLRLLSAL